MSLAKTKLISVTTDNKLVTTDKFLNEIESEITLDFGYNSIIDTEYDSERKKLWILSTGGYLYRFAISEDDITKDITITQEAKIGFSYWYYDRSYTKGKLLTLDKKTGDIFFLNIYNTTYRYLYKIPYDTLDGVTISTFLNIGDSNSYYEYGAVIMFDQNYENIIVFSGVRRNTTYTQYSRSFCKVPKDLSGYKSLGYSVGGNILNYYYYVPAYFYYFQTGNYNGDKTLAYNNILNMYIGGMYIDTSSLKMLYFGNLENNPTYTFTEINPGSTGSFYGNYYFTKVFCGYKTGNIMFAKEDKLAVLKSTGEEIFVKEFPNTCLDFEYNRYSEEFYRVVGNVIYMYDRFGQIITTSSENIDGYSFYQLWCIEGDEEDAPVAIAPNKLVYPQTGLYVDNGQPTLVFEPGINPSGWTQQFRIILNKDYDEINNNDETYTGYDRIVDTWATGDNYKSEYVFEYSTDYVPGEDPQTSGTWNTLGTEEGLQTGGVVPTNGISRLTDSPVYVKFTIPESDALDGIDENQEWYFKVYSYSA